MRNVLVCLDQVKLSGSFRVKPKHSARTEVHLSGVGNEGVVVDNAGRLGRAKRCIIGFGRHCRECCFGQKVYCCLRPQILTFAAWHLVSSLNCEKWRRRVWFLASHNERAQPIAAQSSGPPKIELLGPCHPAMLRLAAWQTALVNVIAGGQVEQQPPRTLSSFFRRQRADCTKAAVSTSW